MGGLVAKATVRINHIYVYFGVNGLIMHVFIDDNARQELGKGYPIAGKVASEWQVFSLKRFDESA